ncbi:hypothetical protein ARTSIC4J27_3067 [Pseudarthrobacter siccitolerans]|uniref:Uncharacterized protein n=1 Tax=Pseudarthrobacter siccitolerans TaxID=861266 RepID=A0A024H5P7_9MICC|nr:hypothetical protein ARTSIC4J27_3067 [Pseudarthrobacter siccitolerans]
MLRGFQPSSQQLDKSHLIHLTKILALEWPHAGIRVNAVAPALSARS